MAWHDCKGPIGNHIGFCIRGLMHTNDANYSRCTAGAVGVCAPSLPAMVTDGLAAACPISALDHAGPIGLDYYIYMQTACIHAMHAECLQCMHAWPARIVD